MAERIRYVKDIGMYAFSRGCQTCKWQTEWCRRYCYNQKFYRVNPKLEGIDKEDNDFWRGSDSAEIVSAIHKANNYEYPERFRFAVRGEIWLKRDDVEKVMLIIQQMPGTLVWIPTRAWRDYDMREWIGEMILPLPNARVVASLDPTNSRTQQDALLRLGWSVIFAGVNEDGNQLLLSEDGGTTEGRLCGAFRCPKTWSHANGHCAVCEDGCFSKGPSLIHLKRHR
jgi:hypothetical protein